MYCPKCEEYRYSKGHSTCPVCRSKMTRPTHRTWRDDPCPNARRREAGL